VQRIHLNELDGRVGERVRVAGWRHHQRKLSRLTFVLLRDASGMPRSCSAHPSWRRSSRAIWRE
jgi:aspartyl-tRNA synthetase